VRLRAASEGVAALGGVENGCKWTMMRHGKKIHRLGRPADQRKALLRALTTQILTHGAIKTTKQKAKAVRPWVDKMIVLAKEGGDSKRQQARARAPLLRCPAAGYALARSAATMSCALRPPRARGVRPRTRGCAARAPPVANPKRMRAFALRVRAGGLLAVRQVGGGQHLRGGAGALRHAPQRLHQDVPHAVPPRRQRAGTPLRTRAHARTRCAAVWCLSADAVTAASRAQMVILELV
jgi:ribosomal protein L17